MQVTPSVDMFLQPKLVVMIWEEVKTTIRMSISTFINIFNMIGNTVLY